MKPTYDEIKMELLHGAGERMSKLRIWAFFKMNPTREEAVDFLRAEYGFCWGRCFSPQYLRFRYTRDGVIFTKSDEQTLVTWEEAEKIIREMVDSGEYTVPRPEPGIGWLNWGMRAESYNDEDE